MSNRPDDRNDRVDLGARDWQLIDRFLDGALADDELQACRRRLEAEPALREGLQQREQLRRGFGAGQQRVFTPSAGFAARVVAATRQLPAIDRGEADVMIARFCRRLLIAAAVIVAATALWFSGLFHDGGDGTLQASPDEARSILEAIDRKNLDDDRDEVSPK